MSTLADRVKDHTASTGTGAITLFGSAPTGFRTFATAFGSGSTVVNYCVDDAAGKWEVGSGVFNGSTGLTRVAVLSSSNANSLVNFSAGTKTVFCTAPAALLDTAGDYRAANFVAGTHYLSPTGSASTLTGLPTTLPASDVYSWAKSAAKPSYTKTEIGLSNVPNVDTTNDYRASNFAAGTAYLAPNGSASGLSGLPTSLPASDVFAWAKAATKPSYTKTEVGLSSVPNLDTTNDYRSTNFHAGTDYLTPVGNTLGTAAGLSATLAITSGGTGALTAENARINLGAQAAGNYATGTGTANGTNTGDNAGVTSVGASAPVYSSGGTTPTISMAAASSGVNGYMSAAYATKLDGVAAGSNAYTHPVNHSASIITQDTSNRFVTDAEKTFWNAKQVAGTYATGSGTASGTNTGDESAASIRSKLSISTLSGSNTGDQTIPLASSSTPKPLGVATPGTGTTFARADHVHLTPTALSIGAASLESPTFTGKITTNIGLTLGATPVVWTSGFPHVELGRSTSLVGRDNIARGFMTTGAFSNASQVWEYKAASTYAVQYEQNASTGTHVWSGNPVVGVLGGSANWNTKMEFDRNGNLKIGNGYFSTGSRDSIHLSSVARPTAHSATCGILFVEAGKLMYMGTTGTVTTIALA